MLIHAASDLDPWPPRFGGAARVFGLARGLAARHDVRLLAVVPNRSRGADTETVAGVHIVRRRAWYTSLAWRLERLGLAPLDAAATLHAARAARLNAALGGTPDALLAELHLAGLFEVTRAPLKVYMAQNVEADHFAATAPPLLARGRWARHVRDAEARAVARADRVIACTDEDAARLAALYGARHVEVIPNGWDETQLAPADDTARARARAALGAEPRDYLALFLASDVPHNRDALRLLLERIMPAAAGAGVRLVVAGGITRALGATRERWLVNAGAPDDVALLLAAADAGVNPVARGGGSSVKLPTALGAGLAVVTTPHGLRGFGALTPLVVVAEPGRFAEVLAAQPRGWRAQGLPMPPAVAALAWGRLGERLGALLAGAPGAAAAPEPHAAVAGGRAT